MRADLPLMVVCLAACDSNDPGGSAGGQRPEPELPAELRASDADVVFGGAPEGTSLGWQVAGAGDLDGDRRQELVASAPSWPTDIDVVPPDTRGRAWLMRGATDTPYAVLLGQPTWQGRDGDHLGYAVSGAGDLDGDGRPDIALGGIGRDGSGEDAGVVILPGALPPIQGQHAYDFLGSGLAAAGDLDGDGRDELLVGAVQADAAQPDRGEIRTWSRRSGLEPSARPAPGARFTGQGTIQGVGDLGSFAAVDLDGDGWNEVALSAWDIRDEIYRDAVYVFGNDGGFAGDVPLDEAELVIGGRMDWYGYVTVAPGGDVDGDGLDELLVGRSPANQINGATTYVYRGEAPLPSGVMGYQDAPHASIVGVHQDFYQAVAAGDLDGDGLSDVIVGAPENATLAEGAGAVSVFRGGQLSGVVGVTRADVRIFGEGPDHALGRSVTTVDYDGDGLQDLAIGGPGADGNRGAVWLFLGSGL